MRSKVERARGLGHVGAGDTCLEPLPELRRRGSESGKFVSEFPGRECWGWGGAGTTKGAYPEMRRDATQIGSRFW